MRNIPKYTSEYEELDGCPVCGGEGEFVLESLDFEKKVPIRIYKCKKCDSDFHNPIMTQKSMLEYYKSGDFRILHEIGVNFEMRRATRLVNFIMTTTTIRPARCLDFGCSRGYVARCLKETFNADVVPYDVYVDPDAIEEVVSDRDKIEGKFDLITCIHTLEHLRYPIKELEWMASMLSDNGTLIIELPTLRKVMTPHPVVFSSQAIPFLMGSIHMPYKYYEIPQLNIAYIVASKQDGNTNLPEEYDEIYRNRPDKWSTEWRDRAVILTLGNYNPPKALLDIGCGNGHTIHYLKEHWADTDYYGIDLSRVAIDLAKNKNPNDHFFVGSLGEIELPIKFNVILLMGVAEHFIDIKTGLLEVRKLMVDGGVVYIEVPNCLDTSISKEEGWRASGSGMQSEWHLKKETWEAIFRDAGFSIKDYKPVYYEGKEGVGDFIWLIT